MTASLQSAQIAFIGAGNMAQAIAAGIIQSSGSAESILAIARSDTNLPHWRALGARTQIGVGAHLRDCRVWIFAVKPQQMHEVIEASRPFLQADTLVISVAAGLNTATLCRWLDHQNVVRTMPNTPSTIALGVTGMYATAAVSAEDLALAELIFAAVGQVHLLQDESLLEAVTALSGSGPAYVFLFIEALIEGGIKLGLSESQAKQMALATLQGATELAKQSDLSPAQLRANVTSKKGTTFEALAVFAQHNFKAIVVQAMQASHDRALELARELSQD